MIDRGRLDVASTYVDGFPHFVFLSILGVADIVQIVFDVDRGEDVAEVELVFAVEDVDWVIVVVLERRNGRREHVRRKSRKPSRTSA
jgi:hypothetical protein